MLQHFIKKEAELNSNPLDYEPYQCGFKLDYFNGNDIDLKTYDIAILTQDKETYQNFSKAFNSLSANFEQHKIIDLGLIIDEPFAVTELVDILLQNEVLPILISPNSRCIDAQFKAYEQRYELLNTALFDSKINYSKSDDKAVINQLVKFYPQLLFHLSCIGHQTFLNDPTLLELLHDKYFDSYRLGAVQSNLREIEPITRDLDFAAFALSAVKTADAPANFFANPNGFSAAEACKIMHYLGLGDRLSALCIHGFDLQYDNRNQSSNLIAQLVWHLIAGYYARKHEQHSDKSQLTAYVVDNKVVGAISFYKSKKSDRWWFEIPEALYKRHVMLACSYRDYQIACEGELSDRLLNAMKRLQ